jgi:hypothetical protein
MQAKDEYPKNKIPIDMHKALNVAGDSTGNPMLTTTLIAYMVAHQIYYTLAIEYSQEKVRDYVTKEMLSSAAKGEVPAFAAQESPGTRWGELQKRFRAEGQPLVGDLDRLVEERRQEGQRQEEESRKANQEQLNQDLQDAAQRQADRIRLEALNNGPDPAASTPEPILLPPPTPDPSSAPEPAAITSPGAAANPP